MRMFGKYIVSQIDALLKNEDFLELSVLVARCSSQAGRPSLERLKAIAEESELSRSPLSHITSS
jgi:hypothetical protein